MAAVMAVVMAVVVKAGLKVAPRAVVNVARVVVKRVVKAAAIVARAMRPVASAMSDHWPKVKCVKSAQAVAAARPAMIALVWKCPVARPPRQTQRPPARDAKAAMAVAAAVAHVKQAQRA